MNILITGSQGYIGKALCEMLCTKHRVIGLTSSKIENDKKYELIKIDLNDTNFTNYIPKNINVVFHLAQSSYYRNFPNKSEDLFNINIASTLKLLDWSRLNGVKKFFFTSSANVYSTNNNKIVENDKVDPQSFYGFSKHASEQMIKYYSIYFNTCILRLFTIYGPKQKDKLIPNIIDKINKFSEITFQNESGIILTPLYIDDLINIMDKLIEIDIKKKSNVFNVCGDEIVSLSKVVNILEKILKKKANINLLTSKPSFIIGDNTRIKSLVSPIQTINIEKGLRKIVEKNHGILETES